MAWTFLKTVAAGTVAAGAAPLLVVLMATYAGQMRPENFVPFMGGIVLIALITVITGIFFMGLPVATTLRRMRLEGATAYVVAGMISGFFLTLAPFWLFGVSAGWIAALLSGAPGGGAVAYVWWSAAVHIDERLALTQTASGRAARFRSIDFRSRDWSTMSWPPRWGRADDIRIAPSSLVMTLGVLAMALVVAAAGSGRLDWLPPQQYFPASLRNEVSITCETTDNSWNQARDQKMVPLDEYQSEWYSSVLRAAGETSLYLASRNTGSRDRKSLRFTWLRSFHAAVIIRVDELPGGGMRLTGKRLSGIGSGRVAALIERKMSSKEESSLKQLLTEGELFGSPALDCRGGADGSDWIVEANDHGNYRFLRRWTPANGAVRDLGMLLMSFTGWQLDPIY